MNILSLVNPNQTWPEWYSYLTKVTVWEIYLFIMDWHMPADFIHKQLVQKVKEKELHIIVLCGVSVSLPKNNKSGNYPCKRTSKKS